MKAKVKNIQIGTENRDAYKCDYFTKEMVKYIGKTIDVFKCHKGWYKDINNHWTYHESWLEFENEDPKLPKGKKSVKNGVVKYEYTDYVGKFRVGDEVAKKLREKAEEQALPVTVVIKNILIEWARNEHSKD